jgi:uncharacterized protein
MGLRLLIAWVVLATPAFAQNLQPGMGQPIPKLTARVTDLTGTLTAEQQSMLEEKLSAFEARKGAQVAVLVVPTTQPEEIAQYSIRVVDQWKLGRQRVDDGALLIVAKNDRDLRIEVGKGLEGALTDLTAHRIISETIIPLLRQGDFYGGINAGLDQMIRVIDGEQLPAPDLGWQGHWSRGSGDVPSGDSVRDVSHLVPFLFVAVLFGSVVLRSLFGRGLGAVIAGAATGAVVYLVGQAIFMAVIAGLIAFLFCLISGFSGGGTWSSPPRAGGFGSGGGFTGGGGFSGGGGGFNGGGASGRW